MSKKKNKKRPGRRSSRKDNTLLLVAGAVVIVYLITRDKSDDSTNPVTPTPLPNTQFLTSSAGPRLRGFPGRRLQHAQV